MVSEPTPPTIAARKRRTTATPAGEKQRPQHIDRQLRKIGAQQRRAIHILGVPHQIGGDPHQNVQHRPYHREHPFRRGERRRLQTVEGGFAAQKVADRAHHQRPHHKSRPTLPDAARIAAFPNRAYLITLLALVYAPARRIIKKSRVNTEFVKSRCFFRLFLENGRDILYNTLEEFRMGESANHEGTGWL